MQLTTKEAPLCTTFSKQSKQRHLLLGIVVVQQLGHRPPKHGGALRGVDHREPDRRQPLVGGGVLLGHRDQPLANAEEPVVAHREEILLVEVEKRGSVVGQHDAVRNAARGLGVAEGADVLMPGCSEWYRNLGLM